MPANAAASAADASTLEARLQHLRDVEARLKAELDAAIEKSIVAAVAGEQQPIVSTRELRARILDVQTVIAGIGPHVLRAEYKVAYAALAPLQRKAHELSIEAERALALLREDRVRHPDSYAIRTVDGKSFPSKAQSDADSAARAAGEALLAYAAAEKRFDSASKACNDAGISPER